MAFTTKFNRNETAYFVDEEALNLYPCVVSDIYIKNSNTGTEVGYVVKFLTTSKNKTKYYESELFYLEEAKTVLLALLAERTAEIGSLT